MSVNLDDVSKAVLCGVMVSKFFGGNTAKANLWFEVRNPHLGNMTPMDMVRTGKVSKLYEWIKTALKENESSNEA